MAKACAQQERFKGLPIVFITILCMNPFVSRKIPFSAGP